MREKEPIRKVRKGFEYKQEIGFSPIVDHNTQVFILGSFPGKVSLAATQYYAHPRNQFWRLLAAILKDPNLEKMPYFLRTQCLLQHKIGVWDVYALCSREGSLDSKIRNTRLNQFSSLMQQAPKIKAFLFNGVTAGRYASLFAEKGYQVFVVPSSSPAHARLSFEEKYQVWQSAIIRGFRAE